MGEVRVKRSLHVGGRGEDVCSPGLLGRCEGRRAQSLAGGVKLFTLILLSRLPMAQTREVLPGVDLLLGDLVQGTG